MTYGKIDNFFCIDNRWTTRLSDVIFKLRSEGKLDMLDEEKSGYISESKNWQYILKHPIS